jgi:hypothetical protein
LKLLLFVSLLYEIDGWFGLKLTDAPDEDDGRSANDARGGSQSLETVDVGGGVGSPETVDVGGGVGSPETVDGGGGVGPDIEDEAEATATGRKKLSCTCFSLLFGGPALPVLELMVF